ncbi:hypothetical protein FE374_03615 [Georgenia yuyongxinii]|uniref:Uncharacterized protein n=1 Tax=Georgenia yuyongxinii TaxID=2589797 RepID=A0A5B8C1C7_9MICO|nr:hypothetical protein [Georgenia yuyongxinii]QDC23840.1 hypothetical protein FE374_03615 [Georgenia yuyongxinii]
MLTEHGCKIAPSTHYAHRSRKPAKPAKRTVTDAVVLNEIRSLRLDVAGKATAESLYGYRKPGTPCAPRASR